MVGYFTVSMVAPVPNSGLLGLKLPMIAWRAGCCAPIGHADMHNQGSQIAPVLCQLFLEAQQ